MSDYYHGEAHWVDDLENSPVVLMANWSHQKAFLLLDEFYCEQYSDWEIERFDKVVKAWGTRPCRSLKDYDMHLADARQKVSEVINEMNSEGMSI